MQSSLILLDKPWFWSFQKLPLYLGVSRWSAKEKFYYSKSANNDALLRILASVFQGNMNYCPKSEDARFLSIMNIKGMVRTVWSVNDGLSGNLWKPLETSGNWPRRFPEVSRGFRIIHHWQTTQYMIKKCQKIQM